MHPTLYIPCGSIFFFLSRSSAKVKVKYQGYIVKNNGGFEGVSASQTHVVSKGSQNFGLCGKSLNKNVCKYMYSLKHCAFILNHSLCM